MKFNKYFDHTNLKPDATKDDIRTLCEDAKKYDFASVCVNGVYTAFAKECLSGSNVKTCVVVGFPRSFLLPDRDFHQLCRLWILWSLQGSDNCLLQVQSKVYQPSYQVLTTFDFIKKCYNFNI